MLVRRDCSYYFVGAHRREVLFSSRASSMEEAWREFKASPQGAAEILFVIRTETEIYLAQGK